MFLLLVLLPIAFLAFVQFEERERPELAVIVILGLLLVEGSLYPTQNEVPGGLFHPSLGGRALRLPEVLIPLALLARVVVRGAPRRLGATAVAWSAFGAWLAVGFPIGVLTHNSFDAAFFQAKAVIYLGGGFALVSGVPAARLAHGAFHRWLLLGLGVVVALSVPSALTGRAYALHLPLVPGASLGRLSPDFATILTVVAVVGLLLEAARPGRRLVVGLAAVPLLLSPLIATQRAAVVGVVAMLLVVGCLAAGPTWARRIRSTPTEGLILLCIVIAPVLVTIAVRAALPASPTASLVPFSRVVTETFTAQRKAQSAETREALWREGLLQARSYPLMGWGLGKTYSVERAAQPGVFLTGGGFHNVLVDLLVRRGIVGVLLFAFAIGCSLRDALGTWRRHGDPRVAVFCGACGAALVGLLAKGAAESVFEKFRLATLLGLLIGAIASAASSLHQLPSEPEDEDAWELA